MTLLADELAQEIPDPIDQVEEIALNRGWSYDRDGDADIALDIQGQWCNYRLFITRHPGVDAILFACAFDMRIPDGKSLRIHSLLAGINERLFLGHFDLWSDNGMPVFRHAVLMQDSALEPGNLESVIRIALDECERYYPAFQFVVWGGQAPEDAILSAVIETQGEA